MDLLSVLARHRRQANDRILVHADQATGLADPTILLKVVQHRDRLVLGEFAAIEGTPLAFGETVLTGPASQDTGGFGGPITEADPQVVQVPAAVVRAIGVLATEGFQVVHSAKGLPKRKKKVAVQLHLP
jgi:hypothetical protein